MIQKITGISVVLAVFFLSLNLFFSDDTWQVKKQFETLSSSLARNKGEKLISTGLKRNRVSELFAPECKLKTEFTKNHGPFSPLEISNRIFAVRNSFSYLTVNFVDINVSFLSDDLARVTLTIKATGKRGSNVIEKYYREADCTLKQINDQWLISELSAVKVLEK